MSGGQPNGVSIKAGQGNIFDVTLREGFFCAGVVKNEHGDVVSGATVMGLHTRGNGTGGINYYRSAEDDVFQYSIFR